VSASEPAPLVLGKCSTCHARFVPIDGPCPRCGSPATEPYPSPGIGKILAATSLEVPPPGWPAPHRLALVEVEDGVRLLVVPDAPLPEVGSLARVVADGPIYRARPVGAAEGARGEGDVPEVGRTRPPFEPPR
jgi:hypothetical protein